MEQLGQPGQPGQPGQSGQSGQSGRTSLLRSCYTIPLFAPTRATREPLACTPFLSSLDTHPQSRSLLPLPSLSLTRSFRDYTFVPSPSRRPAKLAQSFSLSGTTHDTSAPTRAHTAAVAAKRHTSLLRRNTNTRRTHSRQDPPLFLPFRQHRLFRLFRLFSDSARLRRLFSARCAPAAQPD